MHKKLFITLTLLLICVSGSHFLSKADAHSEKQHIYLPLMTQRPVLVLSQTQRVSTTQYTGQYVGEILNLSSTQAFSITIQAVFIDNWSEPNAPRVYTQTARTELPVTLPLTSNPFAFGYSNPPPELQSITILEAVPLASSDIAAVDVTLTALQCTVSASGQLSGSVHNTTSHPISSITVSAWSVRGDWSASLARAFISDTLVPGEQRAFHTDGVAICDNGQLYPGVTTNSFSAAAQGYIRPSAAP